MNYKLAHLLIAVLDFNMQEKKGGGGLAPSISSHMAINFNFL